MQHNAEVQDPRLDPQFAAASFHLVSSVNDCRIDLTLLLTFSTKCHRLLHILNWCYFPYRVVFWGRLVSQGALHSKYLENISWGFLSFFFFPLLPVGFTLNRIPLLPPKEKLRGNKIQRCEDNTMRKLWIFLLKNPLPLKDHSSNPL